jgi:sugar phosphate isomerase/epimerase
LLTAVGLAQASATVFAQASRTEATLPNPFFAMDTGTRDATHQTIESQVRMIKELGFAGWGPIYDNAQGFREMLASLDQHQLKLFALWTTANLDGGKSSVTPRLQEIIQALKGRDTFLWLALQSEKYKPSSTDGDPAAVQALQELSRLAGEAGIRIALYPHVNLWVERVDDAVRLADKVGSRNLGVTFNLCHWLQVDGQDLAATLKLAMPRLFVVTINGADTGGKGWTQLIQPLDRGSFDVGQVLDTLVQLGYTGPIGLQHFGLGGSAQENLKHSMDGWRKLSARAAAKSAIPAAKN